MASEIKFNDLNNLKASYNLESHLLKVCTPNKQWVQKKDVKPYIEVFNGNKEVKLFFEDAKNIVHKRWEKGVGSGVKLSFSDFVIGESKISLAFDTLIWIDNIYGDLHFEFIPITETKGLIKKVAWPVPFEFNKIDDSAYTVLPMMQGCLIPNNWPDEIKSIGQGWYYSRDLYMPWWGQIEDRNGYIAIAQTPWDGGYEFSHPAGGSTKITPIWSSSLGKIGYTRKLRYTFVDNCDYNDLCKIYRDYIKKLGELVTLEEKAVRNPNVNKLIGCPIIHTCIYTHIKPESILYDKQHPEKNDELHIFKQRASELKRLKELGVKKAYVHTDGWGKRGYDNLHPDILPPCEKAGGWEGMKELSDTCRELGYIFATHDQYRDYYLDADTYDDEQAVHDIDGNVPKECTWYGGEQAYLCTQVAPYYVKRNFEKLKKHGIKLEGTYLDVFSVVELDECFNSEHTMTRKECVEKRTECFEYVRSEGIICSSEETVGWAIPHLELCHHSPHALYPSIEKGKSRGIPVPLFNLVYHECIVVPWGLTKEVWGLPQGKNGMLYALLNGGAGYLSIDADKDEIEKNKVVCELHNKVGKYEILKHEFIDGDPNRQKTFFADGTVVEVNFTDDTYKIYNM